MKTQHCAAVLALWAVLATAMPARAVMIQFDPVSSSVELGQRFGIDVIVSGLQSTGPDAQIVSAFDLDVLYDPLILSAATVEFSSALGTPDLDSFPSVLFTAGRIDFANVSLLATTDLFALQNADSVPLARLFFDAVGTGRSSLLFDAFAAPGILLVGEDPFASLPLTDVGEGEVIVDSAVAVSEPAPLALAILGLALIGLSRRSRLLARQPQ